MNLSSRRFFALNCNTLKSLRPRDNRLVRENPVCVIVVGHPRILRLYLGQTRFNSLAILLTSGTVLDGVRYDGVGVHTPRRERHPEEFRTTDLAGPLVHNFGGQMNAEHLLTDLGILWTAIGNPCRTLSQAKLA